MCFVMSSSIDVNEDRAKVSSIKLFLNSVEWNSHSFCVSGEDSGAVRSVFCASSLTKSSPIMDAKWL